jgi:hypothetical protein
MSPRSAARSSRIRSPPSAWSLRPTGLTQEKHAVYLRRLVREDGDTKTEFSPRALEVPDTIASALKEHPRSATPAPG